MRQISDAQRRVRLGLRHGLAPSTRNGGVADIARSVVGLHSSDPSSVFLSARARNPSLTVSDVEEALYLDKSVLRVLGMRRTLFVVTEDVASLLVSGCAKPLAPTETRRLEKMLMESGITSDPGPWLEAVSHDTLAAIRERGQAAAAELTKAVPALAHQMTFGEGRKWAGTVGVSTRVLFLLATHARIVRTRPRGSWISGQYRWAATEDWLGHPLPHVDLEQARTELTMRWLRQYGPGTITDLTWWTGWPITTVRSALARIRAMEVDLAEGTGFILSDDNDDRVEPLPWAAFLPGLDSTIMGWKDRHWYLGENGHRLFDTNGNAGPSVWWQGRVVGGWGQRGQGQVVYRLFEDLGQEGVDLVEKEAASLQDWLGATTVRPRFRTPMEKEMGS